MSKVVVRRMGKKASAKARARSGVTEKRVRDAAGRTKTLRTLDAHSPTFGPDLLYVFSKNVKKARRENKRITGAADVDIRKR